MLQIPVISRTMYIGIALVLLICAALCAGCTAPVQDDQKTPAPSQTPLPEAVHVFSGAGLKAPMQEIGTAFTEKYGIPVEFNYGGGGTLVSQMNLTRKGDVLIVGSTREYDAAKKQGLVNDYVLVAYHVPVIVVQKGNPKDIKSLSDLARPGLKVALGDTSATAIGKAGAKMFKNLNITDDVEKNVVTRTPTINELVTIMNTGQADAAILTLDNVKTQTMDIITIPLADNDVLVTPIGVTAYTQNEDAAEMFVAYVASDEGKAFFAKHGFPVYPDPAYANISV